MTDFEKMQEVLAGKVIWIAEDDAITSEQYMKLLQELGVASVKTFTNPFDVAEKLKRLKPGDKEYPDLICADWNFSPAPKRDGFLEDSAEQELPGGGEIIIDAMRKCGAKIPILIFTADEKLKTRKFTGVDVTIVEKCEANNPILETMCKKLSTQGLRK